jgi:hypothetical protein
MSPTYLIVAFRGFQIKRLPFRKTPLAIYAAYAFKEY